jgi:hypothetical protein
MRRSLPPLEMPALSILVATGSSTLAYGIQHSCPRESCSLLLGSPQCPSGFGVLTIAATKCMSPSQGESMTGHVNLGARSPQLHHITLKHQLRQKVRGMEALSEKIIAPEVVLLYSAMSGRPSLSGPGTGAGLLRTGPVCTPLHRAISRSAT